MTPDALSLLFKRLRKRTGISDKRVSAHNCRRYMATTQLAAGRSPLDVQRQMGHTSLKMTNHYYSQTVEQVAAVARTVFASARAEKRGRSGRCWR